MECKGAVFGILLQPAEGEKPIRNFLDDPRRSGPVPDMDRKEGSRRHVRNWGGVDFDNVKTGSELEKAWTVSVLFCGRHDRSNVLWGLSSFG